MTPEERAFCDDVRQRAIQLASLFAAVGNHIDPKSPEGIMARKGGLRAMELCSLAGTRMNTATLTAEHDAVVDSGYDLNALATATPSPITE